MSKTLSGGENVVTSVLRYFQAHPDDVITTSDVKKAFRDELPTGSGISAAFWTLRQRGLIAWVVDHKPGHVITEAGKNHAGPTTYLSTPKKPKPPIEPASPIANVIDGDVVEPVALIEHCASENRSEPDCIESSCEEVRMICRPKADTNVDEDGEAA
jgi:hypothetical protein